jgi:hypothetical protein
MLTVILVQARKIVQSQKAAPASKTKLLTARWSVAFTPLFFAHEGRT